MGAGKGRRRAWTCVECSRGWVCVCGGGAGFREVVCEWLPLGLGRARAGAVALAAAAAARSRRGRGAGACGARACARARACACCRERRACVCAVRDNWPRESSTLEGSARAMPHPKRRLKNTNLAEA